jgi:hypothetical protein
MGVFAPLTGIAAARFEERRVADRAGCEGFWLRGLRSRLGRERINFLFDFLAQS